LRARGLPGVHGLVSLFRRFNPSADAKLDRHELQWVLKENGHSLTPSEFERIFKYFDKNNEGFISISEFVAAVRGELSAQRDAVVREVYSRIV
jgi:calcium-dependent protein kinase